MLLLSPIDLQISGCMASLNEAFFVYKRTVVHEPRVYIKVPEEHHPIFSDRSFSELALESLEALVLDHLDH